MTRAARLIAIVCLPGLAGGCGSSNTPATGGALQIFVSIPPQKFFVERVGGEYVRVSVLVPTGQSPHSYEPTPQQLARLGQARAWLRIGIGFENGLLPKITESFPNVEVVDTRAGVPLRDAEGDEHHHDGEHADEDEAGGRDPHIWLDPKLVKIQARTICQTLSRLDPARGGVRAHRAAFERELDEANARIAAKLAPFKGRAFFVFHPAYGYFADAYGLVQMPVEVNGASRARELTELIARARELKIHAVFYQPQFSAKSAKVVADSIGAKTVPLDDLAEDYPANLDRMADAIAASMGAAP